MIVRDEAETLARCLKSVQPLADEIIIVDTGSRDGTADIARDFTDHVYDFPWIDDFSAARNFAFEHATGDYVMWLDADDVLDPPDLAALKTLKVEMDGTVDTYMVKYNIAFDSAGRPSFSFYRERILRRCPAARFVGVVHEVVTPFGKIVYADAAVSHRKVKASAPGRNLAIYEKALARGHAFSPRERFYYARELSDNGRPADGARQLETFLSEGQGWVENNIEACLRLSQCRNAVGDAAGALDALLLSLRYDAPRAEICCALGYHFYKGGQYKQAVYWYEQALSRPRNDASGGFVMPDCYGFLPCLQLCLCWDKLGDRVKARDYNERAAAFKPEDAFVLHNRAYFAKA
jgi:hypothetical protein